MNEIGSSLTQFKRRLSGMSIDDLARMVFVHNVINQKFMGCWDKIPDITLREFVGAVEDECGQRIVK